MQGRLNAINPLEVLARGYAVVRRPQTDEVVSSVAQVAVGDAIAIRVQDGEFEAEVG